MKIWNVCGIILAWLLSFVMVIMLVAAPMAFSALSLLDPENVAEAVSDALFSEDAEDESGKTIAETIIEEVDMGSIEQIIGEKVDEDVVNDVLTSDALAGLLNTYAKDLTNAITGSSQKVQFTADKLTEVVEDNIDEIIDVVDDSYGLSSAQKKDLKREIVSTVENNADDIVKAMPSTEEIREAVLDSSDFVESVLDFLAKRNTAKLILISAIVLVSLLIFLLRLPTFKGLRWMSSNLFTAGGVNVAICLFLSLGSSLVLGIADGLEALDIVAVDGIVKNMLSVFTTGVVVRTVIIFVAAVVLLVAYILIRIFCRKKSGKKAAPAVEPAPVMPVAPVAAAPVTAPVVPVYTAPVVTLEPELITEPAPEPAAVAEAVPEIPAEPAEETHFDVTDELFEDVEPETPVEPAEEKPFDVETELLEDVEVEAPAKPAPAETPACEEEELL